MSPVRPRVEGDREEEILDAALELLIEVGYDRLTMDAVARASRASKATLYRRWETKQALVIDALLRAKGAPEVDLPPDTGSLRGDLLSMFCDGGVHMAAEGTKVLGAVCTALTAEPELAAEFRERFIGPKLEVSKIVYARAVERGEVAADADLEIIAPAMAGILLHRGFVLGLPIDEDSVRRVVDHVILPAVLAPVPATTH